MNEKKLKKERKIRREKQKKRSKIYIKKGKNEQS